MIKKDRLPEQIYSRELVYGNMKMIFIFNRSSNIQKIKTDENAKFFEGISGNAVFNNNTGEKCIEVPAKGTAVFTFIF